MQKERIRRITKHNQAHTTKQKIKETQEFYVVREIPYVHGVHQHFFHYQIDDYKLKPLSLSLSITNLSFTNLSHLPTPVNLSLKPLETP